MLGSFLCLIMANKAALVLLMILSTSFAAATASTITVLNDGNRMDCSSNSSGTFCYSLSLALNHMVTDNTTVFIASPEVCVSNITTVENVNNISIYGRGVGKTVICYHEVITFTNSRNIKLADLTIQLCPVEKSVCNVKFKAESRQDLSFYLLDCANVSIHQVKMSSLQGGLAIYNPTGHINISYSTFERNNSSRGGVAVFANHTNYANITFYACIFDANQNSFKESNFRGHGGGLLLQFEYAYNTQTRILDCQFTNNVAAWGGGLFVGYKLGAKGNFLNITNTTFASNQANVHGGGGIDIGFYTVRNWFTDNMILIENVTFLNNSAQYGGGTIIFSDKMIHDRKINNLTFRGCRWENNSAQLSTAVDVSPTVYGSIFGYFPLIITFENCEFTGNKVYEFTGRSTNVTHSGTVMITTLTVNFRGKTIFKGNLGSALYVVAANVVFKSRSNVMFDGNHGNSGGALALVGSATLQFSSHSLFLFQNNKAAFVGGAIYWNSIDQRDYFLTYTCFLKKHAINLKNVSFVFKNNTAHSRIGHSIYASTLRPCRYSCRNISVDRFDDIFTLTCIANFTFDNANKQANIATSVSEISLNSTNLLANDTLMVTPGIVVQLNARVSDENRNSVTSIAVFQNSVVPENKSMLKLATTYTQSSLSNVQLFGTPHSTGRLLVQANRVSTVIDVEMVECPPGFVLSGGTCECRDDEYFGIGCSDSHAYIIYEGYWAGYLIEDNTTAANPANLWTAPCTFTFCSYNLSEWGEIKDNFFLLPEVASASLLSEAVCNTNRIGRICGQCKQNFSVFFKSKEYTCHPETHLCDFGIILFVLSELVPLVIFFITILFTNISFTSGAVNGFILFAQIIDLLYVHKFLTTHNTSFTLTSFSLLGSIYQVIYGFFNLDFFSIEVLSFCLWRGATVLDILVFKYITTVSAILLIVCLVLLMRYCSCWYRCKRCTRQRFNVSMIHGLSAFLVMAYSQSTRVTFDILQPATLKSGKSTNFSVQYAVRLDGSIEYFSWQHACYAVPALIFLVVIVILPPSILLINPFLIKFAALFQSRGYRKTICSQYWLNKLLLIRLKPLFDHFQGCFKDNCRWVAGMYFLYRLVILFLRTTSPSPSSFYIFTEFFIIVFMIFHSSVQPYQKRWHNILDTLIFGNLAVINGLSMFLYFWSSRIDMPVTKGFVQFVQLFLIYCPIFYMVTYTSVTLFKKYCRKGSSCFNERSLDESNELPPRLLMSNSDSYRSF